MKQIGIMLAALLAVTSAAALNFTPDCTDPGTLVNTPWAVTNHVPDNWLVDDWYWSRYDAVTGSYNLCYQDETTMYIQYEWGSSTLGLWRDWEDIYSTEISGQSNAIKAEEGFEIYLDYYFPSDNGTCYQTSPSLGTAPTYAEQYVLFNNIEVADAPPGGEFQDARYDDLNLTCDTWHSFNQSSWSFDSDFGAEEGVNRLVSFNVQFANAYIRDAYIVYGNKMDKVYTIY